MSHVTLQQLLLAGSHFGHLTRRWHPKMKPFILMKRNGIHLIDLRKTQDCLLKACAALTQIASRGEQVLFVGTKAQARDIMLAEAKRAGSPYVNERWLGGTLTNFATIRQGIKKLNDLERKMTDGTFEKISKKECLMIERRRAKLLDSLGGIREMVHLPGALYVVDVKRERIAVAEAKRLGIPLVAIVDTNVDPDLVNFPIPANDDAFKSVALITRALTDSVITGAATYRATAQLLAAEQETAAARQEPPRETRARDARGFDQQRRRRVRRTEPRTAESSGEEKPQPPEPPTVDRPSEPTESTSSGEA